MRREGGYESRCEARHKAGMNLGMRLGLNLGKRLGLNLGKRLAVKLGMRLGMKQHIVEELSKA